MINLINKIIVIAVLILTANGADFVLIPDDREALEHSASLKSGQKVVIDGRVYILGDLSKITERTRAIFDNYDVPKLKMKDGDLGEALAFLQAGVRDFHRQLEERSVFYFSIVADKEAQGKKITLDVKNMKLGKVLGEIAEQVGCSIKIEGSCVYIMAKQEKQMDSKRHSWPCACMPTCE